MISLARWAAAWTAAWNFLAPPASQSTLQAEADDDTRLELDPEERHIRVLMSHWF